ncbi:plastid division protein PDV1 [Nicotiana tabacum]|uniref:Plastid division protein PDV1 n=2 Tax=Nicotiana TaxID=4085 RepID=A0A1S3YPK0_TOBAC|nr:PREDICTED: plastid division protein PDV1 [Nicotiana sylvestris]XP_016453957.1 PREDICTED: plastid division protein PDV1-like [Nicotiana tabacum]
MKWEMEVYEIEAVLEKIWDLHDKLSDAIHSVSRAHFLNSVKSRSKSDDNFYNHRSKKKPDLNSDENPNNGDQVKTGYVFVKEFRVDDDDNAVHEAKSLNAIRTALEHLEDQLEFFHTVQNQQRAERDAALARLEQSRIILAMRLAEHQGKNYKFIEEALSLVGDVRNASQFVSPENLYGPTSNPPGENFMRQKGKRSNALFNILFSSFNFIRKSLRVDQVGGILGNAALVAISMLALMHLQQAGSKEKYLLDLPLGQDVGYNRNMRKVSQLEGSSSGLNLDVLSARG